MDKIQSRFKFIAPQKELKFPLTQIKRTFGLFFLASILATNSLLAGPKPSKANSSNKSNSSPSGVSVASTSQGNTADIIAMEKELRPKIRAAIDGKLPQAEIERTVAELEVLMSRKVNDQGLLESLGILRQRLNRFDGARQALSNLKSPSSDGLRSLALSHFALGEYRKAAGNFARLPDAMTNSDEGEKYAFSLQMSAKRNIAVKAWEQFRLRYPQNEAGIDFLAESYRTPMQKEKLIPLLEVILKKKAGSSEEPSLLKELATLYGASNRRSVELREKYLQLSPSDPEALRALGQSHEERGNKAKAAEAYEKAAAYYGADGAFLAKLAGILAVIDPNRSLPWFEKAHALLPRDIELAVLQAQTLKKCGQNEAALNAYATALRLKPDHVQAKQEMMAIAEKTKGEGEWVDALLQSERKNPKDHALQFRLAKWYLAQVKVEDAYRYAVKAIANAPKEEAYLQLLPDVLTSEAQIVKHFPQLQELQKRGRSDPEFLVLVGRGYSSYKNAPRAAEIWSELRRRKPDLLKGKRSPILDAANAKDMTLTGALAEEYLVLNPTDVDIRRLLAKALSETHAPDTKLRSCLTVLLQQDPESAGWALKLAELDLNAKDSTAALSHAMAWVRIHPEDKRGYLMVQTLAKNVKGQETAYLDALDNLARIESGKSTKYELDMAYHYFDQKEWSKAVEALVRLTPIYPNDARLWNSLGKAQQAVGREDANSSLEKATRLEPGNFEYARAFVLTLKEDADLKNNLAALRMVRQKENSRDLRQRLARALYLNGEFASSAMEWDKLVQELPELGILDSTASLSFLRTSQTAKAKPLLEKRLERAPRDIPLMIILAELYSREGRQTERMAMMERIVLEDFTAGDWELRLAKEKERLGEATEALRHYSRWTQRHPEDLDALRAYHILAVRSKDTLSTVEALRLLSKNKAADDKYRFQLAEIDYQRSGDIDGIEAQLKQRPDWREGQLMLLREYHEKGDMKNMARFESALTREAAKSSEWLEVLGDLRNSQKRTEEAAKAYYDWLAIQRKDHNVYDKVSAYLRDHKSSYLIPALRLGYESFPKESDILQELAENLGKTPQALEAWSTLVSKDKDRIEAIKQAAELALTLGKWPEAIRFFVQWNVLSPKEERPSAALVELYTRTGDKPKLADALESLCSLNPGKKSLLIQLGELQTSLGKTEKAITAYRTALFIDPQDAVLRERLMGLLKTPGGKAMMADVLTEIQSLDSSAHEAQFELAKLMLQQGQREKAYAFLSSALEKSPKNQIYQTMLPRTIHNRDQMKKHFGQLEELSKRASTSKTDKQNFDLFYWLGRGYALTKDWSKAGAAFGVASRLKPDAFTQDQEAVMAVFQAQDYSLAAQLAEKYLEAVPGFEQDIRKVQIMSYEKIHRPDAQIRKALQGLLLFDHDNAGALLRLAEIDLRSGDTASSINDIRNCLQTNPNEVRAYKMLLPLVTGKPQHKVTYVVVLEKLILLDTVQRGDYRLKLADFYQLRRNFRETGRLLSLVVQDKPTDAQVWYRLGQSRNQLRTDDMGEACFKRAWELVPENLVFARTYAQTLRTPEAIGKNLKLFQFLEARGPILEERRQLALSYFYNNDANNSAKSFDKLLIDTAEQKRRQPEACLVYLQTKQPVKAWPYYALRWERDSIQIGYLDTLHHVQVAAGDTKGRLRSLETLVWLNAEYKDFQRQLAQVYMEMGEGKKALPQYGQWTARNSKDLEALKAMHLIADALPDTVALETSLRMITALPNVAPDYHFQLAELNFKFTGDVVPVEKLVKSYGTWKRGKFLLAREYYRRDQVAKLAAFEKDLIEEMQKDPTWLEPVGDLYAQTNRKKEANTTYFSLLKHQEKNFQSKPTQDGKDVLRRAFDKAWLYGESNSSLHLKEILALGYAQFQEDGNVAHAYAKILGPNAVSLKVYQELLKRNVADLDAIRGGSMAAASVGDLPVWRELSKSWTQAEPMSTESWQSFIHVTEKQGDLPERIIAMERLFELKPTDHALCFRIGQGFAKQGVNEKALEYFIRAEEMNPKEKSYSIEVARTLDALAKTELGKQKPERAVEYLSMLLLREPKHQQAQFYVGLFMAEAGDIRGAEPLLLKSMENSNEPKIYLAKAWKLLGEGYAITDRLPKALDAFKRCLAIQPDNRNAAQSRLDIALLSGNKQELPAAYADMVRLDSNHIDACRGLAEIRMGAGEYGQAAALYARVVALNEQDYVAFAEWGEALRNLKRLPEAKAAWTKAYDLGDRSPRTVGGLVRLLYSQGQLEQRIDLLEGWIAQAPEDEEAILWAAQFALKKGDLAHAEELYTQAAAISPEALNIQEGLAAIFMRRDDAGSVIEVLGPRQTKLTAEGRTTYADALAFNGQFEDAETQYRKVLSEKPSGLAAAGLTRVLLERKRPQEARKIWVTYRQENSPEAVPAKVRISLAMHERDKALELARTLVSKHAESPESHLLLAKVQLDRRAANEALKSIEAARQLGTTDAEATFLAGSAQLMKGDIQSARMEFFALQQSTPKLSRSLGLRGLADCARIEKNLSEARDNLKLATELYPSPAVLADLSTLSLALGQIEDAERYAQSSLELDDAFPDGAVALTETMLIRQKPQDAKDFLREALQKNPYACELHNERAKVEMTLKNLDGLTASSKEALALCPDDPMPWFYAGVAADQAYQKQQAETHFAQYRKLGGDGTLLPTGYQNH